MTSQPSPAPSRRPSLLRHATLLLAPLLAHPLAARAAPPPASATAPNILFILADDLGYGDLGCYGQKEIQTPNLDRLAAEGVRFTQFYSGAPVCAPARNTLMTGQNTGHTTIRGNAKINLTPDDTTVAQVLRQAGYATGLIGKWGLGREDSEGDPTHKGFDYFFGYVDQTMAHNYYPTFLVRNETRVPLRNVVPHPGPYNQGVATVKLDYTPDLLAKDAVTYVREHRDHRFFLYFAPTLPHANDEAKPDGMEVPDYGPYAHKVWPTPEKGYAAMVTRLDTQVGELLRELHQLGLDDKTIVFFTSDNGPHAEGGNNPAFFDSSGGLRGKKRDVYEGGIREPMIVRWPGHTHAGTTSDYVGYFPDFLPTAAAMAGVPAPAHLDGISFLPAILGDEAAQPRHKYLYWEFYEGASSQAVRLGNWKGVRIPMLKGPIELYDLTTDRHEDHDVAAEHPDIVARIAAIMDKAHVPSPLWKPGAPANPGAPTPARH
ncbi:MAG TPA: arylsulfatase [Opitutaceae bacterium]|nr:arylsulfatase [Opitutaceae bacterium]